MAAHPFDIDAFLAEPLTARLATNGPTIRPVWYQWDDGVFWLMTGPWTKLAERLESDPEIALVVDVCELDTGRILQVVALGAAELLPWDYDRGRQLLARYLGPDERSWPETYREYMAVPPMEGLILMRLDPRALRALDYSG